MPQAVLISVNNGPPVLFELQAGQTLRIGRAPTSDIILSSAKVSGHHLELLRDAHSINLELSARDTSTNSTGVRESPLAEWEELGHGKLRTLPHRAELLVPFRTAPNHEKRKRSSEKVAQTQLMIQYPDFPDISRLDPSEHILPDAYDSQTGKGRWRYCDRLGEGGLGIVYRAFDMVGDLGTVAVKVSKWSAKAHGSRAAHEAWQVFIMHREAQWSLQCLHRPGDARYNAELASLFVRYLEDHTGFPLYNAIGEFEAVRALYEAPDLTWGTLTFSPPLPDAPYVVMELAFGQPLSRVKSEETLNPAERCSIAHQAAVALGYLGSFGLIHRDFRTSNIQMAGRGEWCRIKVLDLGLVIANEKRHASNPNLAVKACWHRRQHQYDWVPPESLTRPFPNFELPMHSFDAFSLGVLILRLYGGKDWARQTLKLGPSSGRWRAQLQERGLEQLRPLLEQLLGPPSQRPRPRDVAKLLAAAVSEVSPTPQPPASAPRAAPGRSRSRGRREEPRGGGRRGP